MTISAAELQISLRPGTADDLPYVHNTWLNSYQNSNIGHALGHDYRRVWQGVLRSCLEGATVLIAHRADEPSLIIGWICLDPLEALIHFAYVRHALQGFGVGRALLHGLELRDWTITHGTIDSKRIIDRWKKTGKPHPRYHFIDPKPRA